MSLDEKVLRLDELRNRLSKLVFGSKAWEDVQQEIYLLQSK